MRISGIVTALISAVVAIPVFVVLLLLIGLSHLGAGRAISFGEVALLICVPLAVIAVIVFFSSLIARLSPEFFTGFFGTWAALFVLFVGTAAYQGWKHDRALQASIKASKEADERHRREFEAWIANPEAVRQLKGPLNSAETNVLEKRVAKANDLDAEVLHHVLVTFPEMACVIATKADAAPDDLSTIKNCFDPLIANPHTPPRKLIEMWRNTHNDGPLLAKIAERSCDPEVLNFAYRKSEQDIRGILLQNPCTPGAIYQTIDSPQTFAFDVRRKASGKRYQGRQKPMVSAAQDWSDPNCPKNMDIWKCNYSLQLPEWFTQGDLDAFEGHWLTEDPYEKQLEAERAEFARKIADPLFVAGLHEPITDGEEQYALMRRSRGQDLSPEVITHLALTYPWMACSLVNRVPPEAWSSLPRCKREIAESKGASSEMLRKMLSEPLSKEQREGVYDAAIRRLIPTICDAEFLEYIFRVTESRYQGEDVQNKLGKFYEYKVLMDNPCVPDKAAFNTMAAVLTRDAMFARNSRAAIRDRREEVARAQDWVDTDCTKYLQDGTCSHFAHGPRKPKWMLYDYAQMITAEQRSGK